MRIPLLIAISLLAAAAAAADQTLGVVELAGDTLTVRFDASVQVLPGSMLAIYGPGAVEKHPLTKEVIIENRQLVAKAQVIASDETRCQARVTWKSTAPTVGCDVVPLPTEAAPNGPPALTGKPQAVSVMIGATGLVRLPIADPDNDRLSFTWALVGPAGKCGVLAGRTTTRPEIAWTAPGLVSSAKITVVARDPLGQELFSEVTVQATAENDWRTRDMHAFAHYGGDTQPALARLTRSDAGPWLALDGDGRVLRISADWRTTTALVFPPDKAPRSPVAIETRRDEIFVLDSRGVSVFGADGVPRRSFGLVHSASDLALAADGTTFIADQGAGGVQVHEADGRFRCRLGQPGTGKDAFAELTRLALAADGTLYCLDPRQLTIQRFDRHHRHLEPWTIQTDARNPPVDLALHAKGLLVLLANGQIQIFDRKGLASEAWKPLGDSGLVARCDTAAALYVDGSGDVLVTYQSRGLLARYTREGVVSGVRGAALWELAHLAADGRGRLFGLDGDRGKVCEFDPEGWLVAVFGGWEKSGGCFDEPAALAVAPDGSALAVLDIGKTAVVRFALDGDRNKPLIFGQPGRNLGQFAKPIALCLDAAGRIYVLDNKQRNVQAFDAKGTCLFAFGRYENGDKPDELSDPTCLTVTQDGDAAFVFDYDTYEIKKFALDKLKNQGTHINNTGGKGDAPGQFRRVEVLATDRRGLVYVWDKDRRDLQVLDFHGTNAVAGKPRPASALGSDRVDALSVTADGQVLLLGRGNLLGWRW